MSFLEDKQDANVRRISNNQINYGLAAMVLVQGRHADFDFSPSQPPALQPHPTPFRWLPDPQEWILGGFGDCRRRGEIAKVLFAPILLKCKGRRSQSYD